jgi:hypothetical protein
LMIGYAICDCEFCRKQGLVMYEYDLCLARCVYCGHVWISGDIINEFVEGI